LLALALVGMAGSNKLWVGMGNPCNEIDMSLFYSATTITIRNGKIAPFWMLPWLNGEKPKDIAPLIFEALRKKNCNVAQALQRLGG
jgi:hypothetical protein